MDTVLIQLYFEHYGWTTKKIADFIKKPESYVRQVVEEEGFKQPAIDITPTDTNLPAETTPHGQVQDFKDAEVVKQALLQPTYVQAEALLLAKVIEALEDPQVAQRVDAHDVFRAHAATLQSLKQHAVVNKVIDEKNTSTGIQINVIGMIQ